jgi:hypothetical protein
MDTPGVKGVTVDKLTPGASCGESSTAATVHITDMQSGHRIEVPAGTNRVLPKPEGQIEESGQR